MAPEDFEKPLAESREGEEGAFTGGDHHERRKRRKHHHHHHPRSLDRDEDFGNKRAQKLSRHSTDGGEDERTEGKSRHSRHRNENGHEHRHRHHHRHGRASKPSKEDNSKLEEDGRVEKSLESPPAASTAPAPQANGLKRDSWMEAPSALDVDYVQRAITTTKASPHAFHSSKADFESKVHESELNKHHLQEQPDSREIPHEVATAPAQHIVDYTIGDVGAQWRMTKLKAVYTQSKESGRGIEEVAVERFGDLRSFDDAREEQIELERREMYGEGYVGKEKPSGELFQERTLDAGVHREEVELREKEEAPLPQGQIMETPDPPARNVALSQTALNRLKAQMLKAKIRNAPDASTLESEYNTALTSFANRADPEVVILGAMENRMLAGGRNGEVKNVENKRGRERGLVEENENMSIDDMVREERRTKGQAGGEGQRFAERIAKDEKFDNDLEYMDENANKLAKRVQKSEINLKNTAISDFQKMNRILDSCPLCHHEDINTPPVAPLVSLGTRVYLTLPTEPEISPGGAMIIPIQHRVNLLECDDDEWEEIRNFMKSLTRMYHAVSLSTIFYENAASPQKRKHAGMSVIPLPPHLGATAPAFFKEAILSSDEEWTQHKKLIDTLSKAKAGLGKLAFRRTLVKEMPYFHVWFGMDGGYGHVVDDQGRWPKGDLFAREVLAGMLGVGGEVVRRQGRWQKGVDRRLEGFRNRWREFDWTRVLVDG